MPSFQATIVQSLLRRFSPRISDEQTLRTLLARSRKRRPVQAPAKLHRTHIVEVDAFEGGRAVLLSPRSTPPAKGHLVFLPGGAFVGDIMPIHWNFVSRLSLATGLAVTVGLYPLAPESTVREGLAFTAALFHKLRARGASGPIILMGDSAGGGLALAHMLQARSKGLPSPDGAVLISPFLDVTVSAPEQDPICAKEVVLSRAGLQISGRWWAGDLGPQSWQASPVLGNLECLPPTLVFGAGHDILVTDARRLKALAPDRVTYHEEPGMMHDYAVLGFPESRRAQGLMQDWIANLQRTAG